MAARMRIPLSHRPTKAESERSPITAPPWHRVTGRARAAVDLVPAGPHGASRLPTGCRDAEQITWRGVVVA
jgi:hypothetical protein